MSAADSPTRRQRRAAVIFNPVKDNVRQLKAAIKESEAADDWCDTLMLETTRDDPGHGMARAAVEAGVDLVIASGGDGTVRAVVGGLRGGNIPLGIVPGGTGNLLARNLGLPLGDTARAVAVAFAGVTRTIDVGVAELTRDDGAVHEDVFLVMAGLGVDATMIANTNAALKERVGWLAYVESGMRSLPGSKRLRIKYTMDGSHEHSAHVSTILAGNCGVLPGNIELMPGARLDDGELDIAVMQPRNLFGWLMIWRKITWENRVLRRSAFGRRIIHFTTSDKSTMLTYLRGPGVTIRVEEPQHVELDGDELGMVTGIRLRADAGALVVKVPH